MFRSCSFDGNSSRATCADLISGIVVHESRIAGVCYSFNFNKTLHLGGGQQQGNLVGQENYNSTYT